MKAGIESPAHILNLKSVEGLSKIEFDRVKGMNIGATARLSDLETHPAVREHYPILEQALNVLASPQIRNMATIAGNILQRPHCWYYRGDFPCWKKGGAMCFAMAGENKYHAVLGGMPCYIIHPSDTAPVLVALGAVVTLQGPEGTRETSLESIFTLPRDNEDRRETSLQPNEILIRIQIPAPRPRTSGTFIKVRERGSWDFATASAAVLVSQDNLGIVDSANICLGGVAPIPWNAEKAAQMLIGKELSGDLAEQVSRVSVEGAQALEHNAYKIDQAQAVVKKALLSLVRPRM
jgi:xanthine dehydrogenase YagS FAD-binding subunit